MMHNPFLLFLLVVTIVLGTTDTMIDSCQKMNLECRLFDYRQVDFGCLPTERNKVERGMVERKLSSSGRFPLFNESQENPQRNCVRDSTSFSDWFQSPPPPPLISGGQESYSVLLQKNRKNHFHPNESENERLPHFTCLMRKCFTFQRNLTLLLSTDADLWLFIGDYLVVDLGGIHETESTFIQLSDHGLEDGKIYAIDLFLAQRFLDEASLLFKSELCLMDCPRTEVFRPLVFQPPPVASLKPQILLQEEVGENEVVIERKRTEEVVAIEYCGNGIVEEGEECDDGVVRNGLNGSCTYSCTLQRCGDGMMDLFYGREECDDGNNDDGDGCSSECKYEALVPRMNEKNSQRVKAVKKCDRLMCENPFSSISRLPREYNLIYWLNHHCQCKSRSKE